MSSENLLRSLVIVLYEHQQESMRRLLRMRQIHINRMIRRSRRKLLRMQNCGLQELMSYFFSSGGACMSAINNMPMRVRSIGRAQRESNFWESEMMTSWNDNKWIENFRMRRITFFSLVNHVREPLERLPKAVIPGLSIEKKVAVALFKLASVTEYRVVGKSFGIHKCTVCECVHNFCQAVIDCMTEKYLIWPNAEDCVRISKAFEVVYNIPNVIGVIGATHIPVKTPRDRAVDFHNQEGYSSIVLQAVVDDQYRFQEVTAHHPGSTHDAAVLRDSQLFKNIELMIPRSCIVDGIGNEHSISKYNMPYYIVGHPAYPLTNWLMKDYPEEDNPEKVSFNMYLNAIRENVGKAFQRLKGRWRILCKRCAIDPDNMPNVILTCCILHNFVEISKDTYDDAWNDFVKEAELVFKPPIPERNLISEPEVGKALRGCLSAYMSCHYPLKTCNKK